MVDKKGDATTRTKNKLYRPKIVQKILLTDKQLHT
jgi:hypothetical protein